MDDPDLGILAGKLSSLVLVACQGRELPVWMGIGNGVKTVATDVARDASAVEIIRLIIWLAEWGDLQEDLRSHGKCG